MSGAVARERVTEPDPFASVRSAFEEVIRLAGEEETQRMKHSDLERLLAQQGQELMRQLYQDCLDQRAKAEIQGEVRDAEGKERTHKRRQKRELETIFGTVEVERTGYGAEGQESLHPLDAELNLPPERYSLEVRRRVAREASKSSFDETVQTIEQYSGAKIGKRQVEELVRRAAQDFDAFYEQRRHQGPVERSAEGAGLLVISSDGKGVVLHKEDLRPATRKASERKQRTKLGTRLSKGEKRNRKRMATVAAVYSVAPYVRTPQQMLACLARRPEAEGKPSARPRPQDKRVWASLEQEPLEVLQEAFREALGRDPQRSQTWMAVVDGNETQLEILQKLAKQHGVRLMIVLDIFHVLEYLWKAGHVFEREGSRELEHWVLQRLGRILEGGCVPVAAGMRRSATRRGLSRSRRAAVDDCADYLLKYKDFLAYDRYLSAGLPIGSGVIEGACGHLVNDRLGLSGARWRLSGAEAVLRLRALRSSGDFDEYWAFHEAQELERNHQVHYVDRQIPSILHQKAPHLRLIR